MAKRAPFEEESEEDDVKTDTTVFSDEDSDKEYDVETILREQRRDTNGEILYLVKWERYELHRSTWEPASSFGNEKDEILGAWEARKQRVRDQETPPFDLSRYEFAVEDHHEKRDDRIERRAAKRRKRESKGRRRGDRSFLPDHHSESEDELVQPQSPKRTKVKSVPVKRKGVAQTVSKPRDKVVTISDDDESGAESLLGESKKTTDSAQPAAKTSSSTKASTKKPTAEATRPPLRTSASSRKLAEEATASPISTTASTKKPAVGATRTRSSTTAASKPAAGATNPVTTAVGDGNTKAPAKAAPTSSAARKSASSGPPKPAMKVFGGDWTEPKKRKGRVRVSGDTAKDSADPKFKRLSVQNRFQNYGKNEPAPNPDALAMVDPKTGRAEPPKTAPFKKGPTDIHDAYGRRTPPAESRRRRSPTPPSPALQQTTDAATGQAQTNAPATDVRPTTVATGKKLMTCLYWRAGNCQYSAETCPYAHYHTGPTKKKELTCFYWHNGRGCRHSDDKCDFAHFDTGVIAAPPGTFNKGSSFASGAPRIKESDLRLMMGATSPNIPFLGSPIEQPSSAVNPGGPREESPGSNINAAADPRLRRSVTIPIEPVRDSILERTNDTVPNSANYNPTTIAVDPRLNRSFTDANALSTPSNLNPLPETPSSHAPMTSSHSHDQTYESEYQERSKWAQRIADGVVDPRLQNRTSRDLTMPDVTAHTRSPTPEGPVSAHARNMEVDSDDSGVFTYGSIETDMEMAKEGVKSLKFEHMLLTKDNKMIESVYIYMPTKRSWELNLLLKYFDSYPGTKVFSCKNPTQWDFVKAYAKSLLVIVHPEDVFIESLPGLQRLLSERGSSVQVFSIGVQYTRCMREHRPAKYEAQRLFPHGGITFITDDIFVYYPEKATQIIEKFLAETENKPAGGELSKIGARPGVMDWLSNHASKKADEQEANGETLDTRWLACYYALCKLCPMEDYDTHYLPDRRVPLETSHLWSINEDLLPSFQGRWESGDEEGATDYMANHFAGEAFCNTWQYRKFSFVYQRPDTEMEVLSSQVDPQQMVDPKGWMKKYNHIAVVTPEEALKSKGRK